jgi:bifunctional non-homologous end joining protein LigD
MARRDGAGGPLFTRHGNDFARRFSPAVAAITALPGRSFLIDGEAIITSGDGLAVFELIRYKRHGGGWGADLIRSDRARRSRFAPRAD